MDKDMLLLNISGTLMFIGIILILDELHEFGLPIPRVLPDFSVWSVEPFHHWMWGLIFLIVGLYIFYICRKNAQKWMVDFVQAIQAFI